ncbi:MAG: hypothetical protein WC360_02460, partial [Opitutales bacterium]
VGIANVGVVFRDPALACPSVNGSVAGSFDGVRLTTKTKILLDGVRADPVLSGALSVDVGAWLEKGDAGLSLDVGLAACGLSLDAIGWSKPVGTPAGARFGATVTGLDAAAQDCSFDWALSGLVYRFCIGRGDALFEAGSGGALSGLRSLTLDPVSLGRSDLALKLRAVGDAIDIEVRSGNFDVPELVGLLEPLFARMNAVPPVDVEAPAPEPAKVADLAPAAAPQQGPQPPLLPGVPDISFRLDFSHIQTGLDQGLENVRIETSVAGGNPDRFSLKADMGGKGLSLVMDAAVDGRHPWMIGIEDLGMLAARAVSPLGALPKDLTRDGTALRSMLDMPDKISGGSLSADGEISIGERPELNMDLKIVDLRLRQEISFLRSLAGLAKKRVMLEIPFNSFELNGLYFTPDALHINSGFIDGPINLNIETTDVSFAEQFLHMR